MTQSTYIFHRRAPKAATFNVRPHKTGFWYMPRDIGVTGAITPAINQIRMFPFIADENMVVSALGTYLVTGVAAANMQLAVYAGDPATDLPIGPALGSTASIAVATSASSPFGALAANAQLLKGKLYYLAINVDTAALSFSGLHPLGVIAHFAIGDALLSNVLQAQTNLGGYFFGQAFGTWPTFTGASSFTRAAGSSLPAIAFKMA